MMNWRNTFCSTGLSRDVDGGRVVGVFRTGVAIVVRLSCLRFYLTLIQLLFFPLRWFIKTSVEADRWHGTFFVHRSAPA